MFSIIFDKWFATARVSQLETQLMQALESLEYLAEEVGRLREDYSSSPAVAIATRDYSNHPNVQIGHDTRLAPDVNLMASGPDYMITIGNNVKINRRSEICGPVTIGNQTFINSDAYIRQQCRIGDRVLIGPYCRLVSDTHALGTAWQRGGRGAVAAIVIEDGAWLGANVTVIGPVTIGAGGDDRRRCRRNQRRPTEHYGRGCPRQGAASIRMRPR